jgi:glycosyltransferase involved in cell wall biosynthesis
MAHGGNDSVATRSVRERVIDLTDGALSRAHARAALQPTVRVSVVIPALNEAANLTLLLPTLPRDYELVIVDGQSVDATVAVVREHRPDAVVVSRPARGKGDALLTGLRSATGDIIVMMDADGSTNPNEIPIFVEALLDGADFAKGSRSLSGGGSDDLTRWRAFGNRALALCFNTLYGQRYTDLCYGFNAFWRHCLPYLPDRVTGFEIETAMHIAMARSGLHVIEVPSFERRRVHGTSRLRPVRDGCRIARTLVAERVRARPLPAPAAVLADARTS